MEDDSSAAGDLESVPTDDHTVGGESASFGVVRRQVRMMNVVRMFLFAFMITMGTIGADVLFVVVRMHEEATAKDEFVAMAQNLLEKTARGQCYGIKKCDF